ncbi:hypothetical protein JW899_01025 [Candidatus Uhrbacteria bacterium]|nr:hypothetical protein [Candidatus Uhrbacteria bacterium]
MFFRQKIERRAVVVTSLAVTALFLLAVTALTVRTIPTGERATLTERELCDRRCLSDDRQCRRESGIYRPSLERCGIRLKVCLEMCQQPLPEQAERESLRRCVEGRCEPSRNACLNRSSDDAERLDCETEMLACLSQCRLSVSAGLPLPEPPSR